MPFLRTDVLNSYRATTFRTDPHLRLKSREEAVVFVNQSGFIFFWPAKDLLLPSLWKATAGDRPVPDAHDDPGHITWDWKDSLLSSRVWYYGRVIHNRNAMVCLCDLPYFYALSPNYGDPEQDVIEQYEAGQLTQEARWVFDALLREGPLDTIQLKRAAHLNSLESDGRFNRAINELQMQFRLLPIGIARVGAWRYAFIYELSHRHFPNLLEAARSISDSSAFQHILMRYLKMAGAARPQDIARLFRWHKQPLEQAIIHLAASGNLKNQVKLENQNDPWISLPELCTE